MCTRLEDMLFPKTLSNAFKGWPDSQQPSPFLPNLTCFLLVYCVGFTVAFTRMKIVFPALLSLPIGALAGSAQWCHIVNSDVKVNCRAGPHLNSRVVRTLSPGENLYFGCYKRGDCYKDNWYNIHSYLFRTVKVKDTFENKRLTKAQYVGPSNKPGGQGRLLCEWLFHW